MSSTSCQVILWRDAADGLAMYRADRSRRSLASAGLAEVVECRSLATLAGELATARAPVLLVTAGAWFRHSEALVVPPASATGKPVVALGRWDLDPGTEDRAACEWTRCLTTGELDDSTFPNTCPLAAWLPRDVAQAIGSAWRPDESFGAAMAGVCAGWPGGVRTVHFSPLDVGWDPQLRVLQVVTSLQRGGAERVVVDLCAELPNCGVSVSVATIGRPTREGFSIPTATMDLSLIRDRAQRVTRLRDMAQQFGIDLFHAHLLDGEETTLLATSGIPVLTTVHNQRPGWPNGLAAAVAPHVAGQGASLLVACSAAVESDLRSVADDRHVRTVWNGIQTAGYRTGPECRLAARNWRQTWGAGPQDWVLLSVANPRPQKELHRLPAIVVATQERLVAQRRRGRVHLVLCGEFESVSPTAALCVEQLQAEVSRWGIGSQVHFTGSVADVASVIAACQVFVSTSRHEGMSLAQLEALASGIGLVATDVGGVAELSAHHANCRALPVDASAGDFAAAIYAVATGAAPADPKVTPKYFERSVMARAYRRLYPRVIARNRERQRAGLWLVTNNFSTGGAQSSARRLILEIQRRGIAVRAAVLQEQLEFPTAGTRALRDAGVPVLTLPPAGLVPVEEAVEKLLAAIDEDPPQAVIYWNALVPYKLLLTDALLDVPCFDVSPGEMYFASLTRYFQSPLPGLPYRRSTDYGRRLRGAIVKYAGEFEAAREALGCEVHVIPNGVEMVLEGDGEPRAVATAGWKRPLVEDPLGGRLVIGTAARISPQKKLEELLVALRKASGRLPPYVCRIAGGVDGGSHEYAEQLKKLGAGLPIEWLGEPADMHAFLRGLDFFVMISEPAGCPNASLEALAAGVPVIATDWGGAKEQIIPDVTGVLTARGEAWELAQAMIWLARDGAARQRFAAAGRRHVGERFSMARMADAYLRVLGL